MKKKIGGISFPEPKKVLLSSINFAPYNPRTITPGKMKSLKASLEKHGLVLNLVVQKKGMVLIGGHQRVRAMRELCEEKKWDVPTHVWAIVLDVPDAIAKQLNVTLNNVEGEFDAYRLGELFASIEAELTPLDMLSTGFDEKEIRELIDIAKPPEELAQTNEEPGEFARSVTLSVEFNTVEERDQAKTILMEAVKGQSKKPGTILLSALKASKLSGRHRAVVASS